MKDKYTKLTEILTNGHLNIAIEVHNGLSGIIAEQSGAQVLWASGYSISTSLGYRDANEISWSQLVSVVDNIVDRTNIPVLVDGDTGYGNFNNARILACKLQSIGAAGICIEDKKFPKTNSLVTKAHHELVSIEEFQNKIKAIKDSVDYNFTVIARTESYIAGHNTEEALKRAEAYIEAGADGILVHSNKSEAYEIFEFCNYWYNKKPVLIVPTTYYNTTINKFKEAKISLILCSNQMIRSSILAMKNISEALFNGTELFDLEKKMIPIKYVLDLMHYNKLQDDEQKYS